MLELELTYLAKYLPSNLGQCKSKEVLDIYLPSSANHPVLRVRKNGDEYEITKKQPAVEGDSSTQIEQTIPLTKEEFEELATLPGKRVRKIRYFMPYADSVAEVGVFQDELAGLVLIDFEFENEADKKAFPVPDFCLADVSNEDFLAGGMLCGKSYRDIETDLNKFAYRKIVERLD